MPNKTQPRGKKVSLTFSRRDYEALTAFAEDKGVPRAVAIRHIVHEALKTYNRNASQTVSKNQLGLFDSVQIDIFNNASKTEDV
jgi:hypothetical protein